MPVGRIIVVAALAGFSNRKMYGPFAFRLFCLSRTKKTVRNNGETLFEVTVRPGCTAFYNCVDYFLLDNI